MWGSMWGGCYLSPVGAAKMFAGQQLAVSWAGGLLRPCAAVPEEGLFSEVGGQREDISAKKPTFPLATAPCAL